MISILPPITMNQKRLAMEEILSSQTFARSDQLRNFLKFICEQEMAERGSELNEYLIGVEVLGRPPNYSPSEDATVRNRAHVLRKKLHEFYEHEGITSPIRIELPKGSYCPLFLNAEAGFQLSPDSSTAIFATPSALHHADEPSIPIPALVEQPKPEAEQKTNRWRWALAMAIAAVVVSLAAWKLFPMRTTPTALEQFWEPVLKSSHPVLICQSPTVVYMLSGKTKEKQFSRLSQEASPSYEFDPTEQIPGSDLIPRVDSYVSMSNSIGALKLANMFGRLNKPTQFKKSNEANFDEMRNAPTILLGGFNNRWTMSLINNQRFVFEEKAFRHRVIVDKQDPTRIWGNPNTSVIGQTNEDYAIISRVFQSETGEILIKAAGIFEYGTRAAGELLTNPVFWEEFAKQAPEGWQTKNLQIVFSVKVIDKTPGPPTLLATHFW